MDDFIYTINKRKDVDDVIYTMTIKNFFLRGSLDWYYSFEINQFDIDEPGQGRQYGKLRIVKPSDENSHIFWEQYLINDEALRDEWERYYMNNESATGDKALYPEATITEKYLRNGKFSEGYVYEFSRLWVIDMKSKVDLWQKMQRDENLLGIKALSVIFGFFTQREYATSNL